MKKTVLECDRRMNFYRERNRRAVPDVSDPGFQYIF